MTTLTMDGAVPARRVLVLQMDEGTRDVLVAGLGGGLGMKLIDLLFGWLRRKQREPVEFQARVLDTNDTLTTQLLEREARMAAEKDAAIERAHRAELEAAVQREKNTQLQGRLDRKDEQNKALQNQVISLGHVPVYATAPSGRKEES